MAPFISKFNFADMVVSQALLQDFDFIINPRYTLGQSGRILNAFITRTSIALANVCCS